MNSLVELMGENLKKQPWSLPAWRGNVRCYGDEMVLSVKQAERDTLPSEPLHIWEYPIPGAAYIVALDPSSGVHRDDPAAIQIVGHGSRQVAEMLLEQRSPDEQLRIAVWLCRFYNEATLAVEMNGGPGAFMMQRLNGAGGYGKLWRDPWTGHWGWLSTSKSNERSIAYLQQSLKDGFLMMRSLRMREQLDAFKGNGPADDDLVRAFTIAHYCAFNNAYTSYSPRG